MNEPVTQPERLDLSVIVPVYNGEAFIVETVRALTEHLASRAGTGELIVVDDGSTDRTPELLRHAAGKAPIRVRVLRSQHNQGKGAAITHGMRAAGGDYRVFIDADLTYPPEQIDAIETSLADGADVAIACRAHPASQLIVHTPHLTYFLVRRAAGRFLNWIVRLLLLPGIVDSQAGLKGFSAATAEHLFSGWLPSGFSFDLALLFRARRLGLKVEQVPVTYRYDREPSTVHLARDTLRMLGDVLQIRLRLVSNRFEHWGGVATMRHRRAMEKVAAAVQSPVGRAVLLAGFGLLTLTLVLSRLSFDSGPVALGAWLGTLTVLLLWGWRIDLQNPPRPARLFRSRRELILFTLIFVAGALLRFYRLGDLPPMIHGDSADCGLLGMEILRGAVDDVFDFSPWYSTPYISFLMYAMSFKLHGLSIFALRLPSAILGVATLVPLYFLVRGWLGVRAGLLATALFATSHAAIHFSRIGLWNVQVLFCAVTVFALLTAGMRQRSIVLVTLAGLVSGLALYSYTGGRLIPITVVTFCLFVLAGGKRDALRTLAYYTAALAVAAVPLFLNYVERPEILAADRTASVWVLAESNQHHVESTLGVSSVPAIFWEQTKRTVAGFAVLGDTSAQYGTEQPLLAPATALLSAFGLLIVLRRWRRPRNLFLLLWLGLGMLLGSILVIDPPAHTRLIVLFPVPCILTAIAFEKSLRVIRTRIDLRRADLAALCVLVVAQSATFDLLGYREFTRRMALESREWDVLKVMERLGNRYEYYLYTGPFVFADSPIFRLFSTGTRSMNGFTEADLPKRLSRDAALVLTPQFRRIGLTISDRFPHSERQVITQEGIRQMVVYRCTQENSCRRGNS